MKSDSRIGVVRVRQCSAAGVPGHPGVTAKDARCPEELGLLWESGYMLQNLAITRNCG